MLKVIFSILYSMAHKMKTLRLNSVKSTGDIDADMKTIHAKYGKRFFIEFKVGSTKCWLPFRIVRCPIRKVNHWILKFVDIDEEWTSPLNPLCIYFVNLHKNKMDNESCYLSDLHRGYCYKNKRPIAGTAMLQLAGMIAKQLGIKSMLLGDGAYLWPLPEGEYDGQDTSKGIRLSLYKLMERGSTFYEKYGYKLSVPPGGHYISKIKYGVDAETTIARRGALVREFKNITTAAIMRYLNTNADICTAIIKSGKYNARHIKIYKGFDKYVVSGEDRIKNNIKLILSGCADAIERLVKYKSQAHLYKVLTKAVRDKQYSDYVVLIKECLSNNIRGIKYKGVVTDNPVWMLYHDLGNIMNEYYYEKVL